MTDADKIMHPQHFGHIRQTSGSGLIRKSGFKFQITSPSNFGIGGGCTLSALIGNLL